MQLIRAPQTTWFRMEQLRYQHLPAAVCKVKCCVRMNVLSVAWCMVVYLGAVSTYVYASDSLSDFISDTNPPLSSKLLTH
jgi:hypothetical protein